MVEALKAFFLKFISGRLGLAVTFWLCGVVVAFTLNFLTSHSTTIWQVVTLALITFTHFLLITIAVWYASGLYLGNKLWKWLARIIVIFSIARWAWYAPLYFATIVNAFGITVHSEQYWQINSHDYVCAPADYTKTPDLLVTRYGCIQEMSKDDKLIMLTCQQANVEMYLMFTKNERDCQSYLTKLKHFLRDRKK
jgi:hypothetical protein